MKHKKEAIILAIIFVLANASLISAERISSEETTTDFIIGGNSPICIISSSSSSWSVGGVPTPSTNDCYNENGVDINGDAKTSCCPNGYTCNQQTGNCAANAVPPPPAASSCNEYTDDGRDVCEASVISDQIKNLIEQAADIEDSEGNLVRFCHSSSGTYTDENSCVYAECEGCRWSNRESKCVESYLLGDICNNPDPTIAGARVRCETTTNQLENQCSGPGGSIILSWAGRLIYMNADGTSGGAVPSSLQSSTYRVQAQSCTANSKEFPCPVTAKLPFFGFFNLIISILAIGMIYYLIARKKIKFI